jgi:Mg-chelatase subunit ChlD
VVLTIIYPHYPIINHHDQQNRWSMMVISDGKKSEALTQSQLSRVQPKRRMTSWQLTANARGLW